MKNTQNIQLRQTPEGTIIAVKAVPGASRDKVVGVLGDALKLATSTAPEKGRANVALARTLAKALGMDKSAVTLHAGQTNPRKEFLLAGLDPQDVLARLARLE